MSRITKARCDHFYFVASNPAHRQEAQLRFNHAIQLLNLDQLEATITTPGWLMDGGQLWISLCGDTLQQVTVVSPALFPSEPNGTIQLLVKGVKHLQDQQGGTRTEVTVCNRNAFGNQISSTNS